MIKKDYAGRLAAKYRIILVLTPLVCFGICLCLGRMTISPTDIFRSVFSKAGLSQQVSGQIDTVVWSMRIPRLILAAIAGVGLSVSGCTFQSLFSNPLATPDTLGVASGASFGAALALLLGFGMIGVQITALVFGMSAVILTGLSGHGIGNSRSTPILAGIMISSLFSSLVSLIKFTADTESQLPAITYWLMGSMESAGYNSLKLGAPPVLVCTVILLLLRWKMNLLPLNVTRYRLTEDEILLCCREGYRLGYRTFVLQGGESRYAASEQFLEVVRRIKTEYPDCAITLSVGECSRNLYEEMYKAGADRYLLRHETADKSHYESLHPSEMSFDNRIRCLYDLREIGFQTGCGMMVGTPNQTPDTLAADMEFMGMFQPAMVGIGPFLPHKDTPFSDCPAGSQELTLFLLSLTRIMLPDALIPATTALGTAAQDGRIQGVSAGCNVVMPNLSPQNVRKSYMLYDNKSGTELSAEESLNLLKKQMESIGREVIIGRGDHKDYERNGIQL